MKVEDIHKNNIPNFAHITDIFNQYYQVKSTPYITRQEGNLDIPLYRIEYGARSVKVVGAKLWNILENDLEKYKRKPWDGKWGRINISKYNAI